MAHILKEATMTTTHTLNRDGHVDACSFFLRYVFDFYASACVVCQCRKTPNNEPLKKAAYASSLWRILSRGRTTEGNAERRFVFDSERAKCRTPGFLCFVPRSFGGRE